MDSLQHRATTIFQQARGVPVDARDAFVARACEGDVGLAERVGELLAAYRAAGDVPKTEEVGAGADLRGKPGDQVERLREAFSERYEILGQAGRGGMATVYRARDLKHGREVAIKVLTPEVAAAIGPSRFLREIRIAASLQHPNILALYDSGETDGLLHYVMPFVEGGTLRERIDREGPLPLEDVLAISREVADALDYAHGRGVVHRDVKPGNILFQGGYAVLADFGLATAVQGADEQRLTQTGMVLGTPAYMSPEQASGAANDGRSDLYSLGCVV